MDAGNARPTGRGVLWAACLLAGAVWSGAAGAAERVALVIGNGAYEHVKRLPNPGNDATDVGAAFERLGYAVTRLDDAGETELRQGLRDFRRAASASEVAVVFYAGHGMEVDGRNFLVPVDARLQSDQDVEYEAVPLALVTGAVGGARRLGLVVLDACRDNPFVAKLADAGATRSIGRGLARVAPSGGTLVAYAAEDGKTAADGTGRNSPYTGALLRYLEEPGLEVGRLFRKVRAEVERTTGGRQTPHEYGKLPDADIYLASAAAPPPPPPPGGAKAAYEAAERLNTVAAYRIVVEGFPGSIYAKLAQAWIDKHEQAPVVVAGGEAVDEAAPPSAPSPEAVEQGQELGHEEMLVDDRTHAEAVEQGLKLSEKERMLIQMGLTAAKHDPGPADGKFGPRTRKALLAWQGEAQGEAGTGYLDADEAKALLALGKREEERLRAEGERKAQKAEALRKRARKPRDTFRDCPECPEMVVVPSGSFMMGSTSGRGNERPVHRVTFARPFAVGVYEVTFAEWDACVSDGGCGGYHPDDEGWGRGDRPAINVSWSDAKAYVRWLSGEKGLGYRLLSESEWEYVARAGTTGKYHFGSSLSPSQANYGMNRGSTVPVGSYPANAFGLYDVHGNVYEWVEDCWNDSYAGAPADGSERELGECGWRVLRGGSWDYIPGNLRSAHRSRYPAGNRNSNVGFRVARTLTP